MAIKLTTLLIFPAIMLIVHSLTEAEIAALIQEAQEFSAPFQTTALNKIHEEIFGSSRAARSTDVAIINRTDKQFKLQDNGCGTGRWTETLVPENVIEPHTSVVHGTESSRFATGATDCFVKYLSTDGKVSFELSTSNPYIGPVRANGNGQGVDVEQVVGIGNNNLVRFILE